MTSSCKSHVSLLHHTKQPRLGIVATTSLMKMPFLPWLYIHLPVSVITVMVTVRFSEWHPIVGVLRACFFFIFCGIHAGLLVVPIRCSTYNDETYLLRNLTDGLMCFKMLRGRVRSRWRTNQCACVIAATRLKTCPTSHCTACRCRRRKFEARPVIISLRSPHTILIRWKVIRTELRFLSALFQSWLQRRTSCRSSARKSRAFSVSFASRNTRKSNLVRFVT